MEKTAPSVLIAGNPNVGKSLLFSRITGLGVITSNYSGTTVGVKTGHFSHKNTGYKLVDMPGLYSLDVETSAEQETVKLLDDCDMIINVVDATNLERNLNMTLQLAEKRIPMVICLNFWDETIHKGIAIDHAHLAKVLGAPVIPVSALQNTGIRELLEALDHAAVPAYAETPDNRWAAIGGIISQVQKLSHRHHTLLEILSDFTLHPAGGLVSALLMLVLTFWGIRTIGETLINQVLTPLFDHYYLPAVLKLIAAIPWELAQTLLVGQGNDIMRSFGILTTGIYISVVLVFPYFLAFYLIFGILEDFGFLPRLAVTFDSFFHRIGLHGYSSIPVMLGLGCNVPAFMATRMLATKREKVLTYTLIIMSAPCMPQSAMIFSIGMRHSGAAIAAVFGTLLVVALVTNLLLNRLMKGVPPDLFMEIPSYRMPSLILMARKLQLRIGSYFLETIPMIIIGVFIINIIDTVGALQTISQSLGRTLAVILSLPEEMATVVILGFLRKDVSIAMLAPFDMTTRQFVVASVFLVLYLPCIASFFSLIREAGPAQALKVVGLTFTSAVGVALALNWAFLAHQYISLK